MVFKLPPRPIRIVLRWQLIVTAVLTLVAALLWGRDGAISAALGGAVNVVAGWGFAWGGGPGGGGEGGGGGRARRGGGAPEVGPGCGRRPVGVGRLRETAGCALFL